MRLARSMISWPSGFHCTPPANPLSSQRSREKRLNPPERRTNHMPSLAQHPPEPSKVAFFGLTADELDDLVQTWGWPRFRGKQVREWVYQKGVIDPQAMTNLGKTDRDRLSERFD